MSEYTLCHAREVRTFVTIRADNDEQALARVQELDRKHSVIDNDIDEPPEWFVELDSEDNDPGEWEIREVQEDLPAT